MKASALCGPGARPGAPGAILPSNVEEASPEPQATSDKRQAAKKDLTGAATVV